MPRNNKNNKKNVGDGSRPIMEKEGTAEAGFWFMMPEEVDMLVTMPHKQGDPPLPLNKFIPLGEAKTMYCIQVLETKFPTKVKVVTYYHTTYHLTVQVDPSGLLMGIFRACIPSLNGTATSPPKLSHSIGTEHRTGIDMAFRPGREHAKHPHQRGC